MGFYDEMRTIASDVIGEFKQGTVTYVRLIPNPGSTPDEPLPPIPQPVPIEATVRPVSTKYVDNSHIVQSDKQVTFAAGAVTPDINGSVDIDGARYKIIEVMPTPAAGTVVTYTLIVRR